MTQTLAGRIAEDLRRLIEQGHYLPGAPIRQEEIALRLGVSRIPLREAFRLLEAEGLVTVHPNRGAFVTEPDPEAIAELFDVRLLLEEDLLRRATGRLTADSLASLQALNALLTATRDPEVWVRRDEEFHFAMYAAASRPRTLELARMLRRSLNAYYLRYLGPQLRAAAWRDEHDSLIRALRRRNADRAVNALRRHLRATQKILIDALEGTRNV